MSLNSPSWLVNFFLQNYQIWSNKQILCMLLECFLVLDLSARNICSLWLTIMTSILSFSSHKNINTQLFVDYCIRHLAKFGLHFLTVAWCSWDVQHLSANLSTVFKLTCRRGEMAPITKVTCLQRIFTFLRSKATGA